jgi:hypothetical protein
VPSEHVVVLGTAATAAATTASSSSSSSTSSNSVDSLLARLGIAGGKGARHVVDGNDGPWIVRFKVTKHPPHLVLRHGHLLLLLSPAHKHVQHLYHVAQDLERLVPLGVVPVIAVRHHRHTLAA